MVRALVAAAIAAFFMSNLAAAQECEKPQAVMQMVMDRLPQVRILDPLTSTEIEAVVRGYNSIEPVSEFVADEMTVMTMAGFANVYVIASKAGCVVFRDELPIPLFLMLMGRGA